MSKSLQEFHTNKDMKENVHEYLVEYCKVQAVEKAFNREDTSAVAEAKEIIDKAFDNLELLFSPKSEGKKLINEAR